MLQTFVITLREGVEAALIVGITLTYLREIGRGDLRSAVHTGLAVALGLSVALGVGFRVAGVDPESELVEGILYLAAGVMVAGLVAWMWVHGRGMKRKLQEGLRGAVSKKRPWTAMFLFVLFMVGREGVETVLMLTAAWFGGPVGLSTESLLTFGCGLAGLGLAVVFGVLFVRGSVRIPLGSFMKVTSAALGLFAFQLLVNGAHELLEWGYGDAAEVPAVVRSEMALVGPVVRHGLGFVLLVLMFPLAFVVLSLLRRKPEPVPGSVDPAEARLLRARARQRRRTLVGLCTVGTGLLIVLSLGYAYSFRSMERTEPVPVRALGGVLRIPLSRLQDGRMKRFGFRAGGRVVRFLAKKMNEDRYACALDACRICGSAGYMEQGPHLICLNCTAEINPLSFGRGGGCNPIPLGSRRDGDSLLIRVRDLEAWRDWFPPEKDGGAAHHRVCPGCQMELGPGTPTRMVNGIEICTMESCGRYVRKHAPVR